MSEAQDEGQEKSFEPSERKLQKSREDGDVPQSQELNTLLLYGGFILWLALFSAWSGKKLLLSLTAFLERPYESSQHLLYGQSASFLQSVLFPALITVFGIFVLLALAIIISLILQRALVISPKKIKPKLSRLSPMENAKQKYGPKGLFEFTKKIIKLTIVAIIGSIFIAALLVKLPQLAGIDTNHFPKLMRDYLLNLTIFVTLAFAFIVSIDVPYAWTSHRKKLRMTFKEMQDENKESEGDPFLKSERRRRAMAISQGQMLSDVKTADVIIVNPTHYAVALKWNRKNAGAPICVAKGVDELALTIRRLAGEFAVPIYSDPPCARSIFAMVDIGETIEPQHYAAVAASIKFADEMKRNKPRE